MRQHRERVQHVMRDHAFRLADRRQVVRAIPLGEQREVGVELRFCGGGFVDEIGEHDIAHAEAERGQIHFPVAHQAEQLVVTPAAGQRAGFIISRPPGELLSLALLGNVTVKTLDASDAVMRQVEGALAQEPDIAKTMSNLGRGNPQIYYNVFQKELASNYAEVFVELERYDERRTTAVYDRLRAKFAQIPGAEIVLKEFENGPPIAAPIAIRLVGPELAELRKLAGEVEAIINAVPGTRDVINPLRRARLDLELAVDPQRAGLLGVRPVDLDQSLRLAVAGLPAGDFRTADGDNYPVVLRAPMQARSKLDTLDGLHVGTVNGTQVPLAQLAELKLVESPAGIERYDRARSVTISGYTRTGYHERTGIDMSGMPRWIWLKADDILNYRPPR